MWSSLTKSSPLASISERRVYDSDPSHNDPTWRAVMKSLYLKMPKIWGSDTVGYEDLREICAEMKVATAKLEDAMECARAKEMEELRETARRSEESARQRVQVLEEILVEENKRREDQEKAQACTEEALKQVWGEEKEKRKLLEKLLEQETDVHYMPRCYPRHTHNAMPPFPFLLQVLVAAQVHHR